MAKIGTSLTGCLRSIARGQVAIDDVQFVVTSTAYASRDQMVEGVRQTMLGRDVDTHVANACALWDSGRIFQPSVRPDGRSPVANWIDADPVFAHRLPQAA